MNNAKNCSPKSATNLDYWINNFFNHSIGDVIGSDFVMNQASVNITELPDAYKIALAAPGLEKSDFDIQLDKDRLTISVDKASEQPETKDKNYKRREFNFNSFKRSFHLNEEIEVKEINATYKNGILELLLPKKVKAEEEVKRSIEIS